MNTRFVVAFAALAFACGAFAQEGKESTEGMAMQAARAKMMTKRGATVAYTRKFDLSGLPPYEPRRKVSGTIRAWGSNYITDGMIGGYWEDAFRKYHPDVKFDWRMKTTLAAVPSLIFGVSDVGIGRKITFSEQELFERYTDRSPIEIELATGSFDVPGWQPGYGVVVHKDNPLTKITMEQLDGIFGSERAGGWEGTSWRPNWARGPEKNIRTWGQLGLTGEWADKPINVYGLNLRYNNCDMFEHVVFHGGDKWNERLHEYANYVKPDGSLAIAAAELMKDLGNDRYGIGWSGIQNVTPQTKALDIAAQPGGPYVKLTIDNVQNRTYPLAFEMFFYVNRKPGTPLDPKVKEFLRYVLSREGQEAVQRDGKYLPLTPAVVREQLQKLN